VVLGAGRISAAARVLHLSQPAVTAQIRKLEGALGAALFTRSASGVAPTPAGARLATHARAIQRLLDEAVAEVSGRSEAGGELLVAASTTVAAHVLPPVLAQFRRVHRDVALKVRVGNTSEVIDQVRTGQAPLGLVEGHARAPGVRLEPFLDDEIVPVVGRDASFRVRAAKDLADVPILWREAGSGTRSVVERALARAGAGSAPPRTTWSWAAPKPSSPGPWPGWGSRSSRAGPSARTSPRGSSGSSTWTSPCAAPSAGPSPPEGSKARRRASTPSRNGHRRRRCEPSPSRSRWDAREEGRTCRRKVGGVEGRSEGREEGVTRGRMLRRVGGEVGRVGGSSHR
jgi:DNA-binding transcriptional LysR family regulator